MFLTCIKKKKKQYRKESSYEMCPYSKISWTDVSIRSFEMSDTYIHSDRV